MRPLSVGAAAALAAAAGGYATLYRLGQTWGATDHEQRKALAGDELLPAATALTTHAITIAAPPNAVWPWLVQMGWHRGSWYTARSVDRLLFPANWPSATQLVPELQQPPGRRPHPARPAEHRLVHGRAHRPASPAGAALHHPPARLLAGPAVR